MGNVKCFVCLFVIYSIRELFLGSLTCKTPTQLYRAALTSLMHKIFHEIAFEGPFLSASLFLTTVLVLLGLLLLFFSERFNALGQCYMRCIFISLHFFLELFSIKISCLCLPRVLLQKS